jgi:hypothetical protein
MEAQMKEIILKLSSIEDYSLEVLFHHTIDSTQLQQVKFTLWLEENGIDFKDISGSESALIQSYTACDLHVGYRVHAHIFCSSISRPSVLLSEDGRGVALKEVVGGLSFKAYTHRSSSLIAKVLGKLKLYDIFTTAPGFVDDVVGNIDYEFKQGRPRISLCRFAIDGHYLQMEKMICQLP